MAMAKAHIGREVRARDAGNAVLGWKGRDQEERSIFLTHETESEAEGVWLGKEGRSEARGGRSAFCASCLANGFLDS